MPFQISRSHYVHGGTPVWAYSGSLYLVTTNYSAGTALSVLRSRDMGKTWAEADAGNRPTNNLLIAAYSHPNAGVLYIAKKDSANSATIERFDMANNVWLSAIGSAATTDAGSSAQMRVVGRSASDIALMYRSAASVRDLYITTWDGASWTAPSLITTDASGNAIVMAAALDSAGIITFTYDDPAGADGGTTIITVAADRTIGAEQMIYANDGVGSTGTRHLAAENDGAPYLIFPVNNNNTFLVDANRITLGGATPRTVTALASLPTANLLMDPMSSFTFGGKYHIAGIDTSTLNFNDYAYNGSSWDLTTVRPYPGGSPPSLGLFQTLLGGVGYVTQKLSGSEYLSYWNWYIAPPGFSYSNARNFQLRPTNV